MRLLMGCQRAGWFLLAPCAAHTGSARTNHACAYASSSANHQASLLVPRLKRSPLMPIVMPIAVADVATPVSSWAGRSILTFSKS